MKSTRFVWRTLSVLCAVLFVTFGFTGCQPDPETEYVYIYVGGDESKPDSTLIGDWKNSGEEFNITASTFANSYFDSYSTNTWVETYTGKNLYVLKLSDTEGYIYMEYTKSMNEDYTYSTTAPDVGKWYALHYQNLTSSSISISGAYNASGVTSTDTLAEAIQEFTVANGYFSYYSECTK